MPNNCTSECDFQNSTRIPQVIRGFCCANFDIAFINHGVTGGEAMADWSLTSLQLKLIKIGARVVRHARAITFQLAEVVATGSMVRAVLCAIRRLRAPPSCA